MLKFCATALSWIATIVHPHSSVPKPKPKSALEEDLIKALNGEDSFIGKELKRLADQEHARSYHYRKKRRLEDLE